MVDPVEERRRKLEEAARKKREALENTMSSAVPVSPAEHDPLAAERIALEMARAKLDMERSGLERERSASGRQKRQPVVAKRPKPGDDGMAKKAFMAGCFGMTGVFAAGFALVAVIVLGFCLFSAWFAVGLNEAAKAARAEANRIQAAEEQRRQADRQARAQAEREEENAKQEARNEQFARERERNRVTQATDELGDICETFGATLDPRKFVDARKRLDQLAAAWVSNKQVSAGAAEAKRIASAQRNRVVHAGLERAKALEEAGNIVDAVDVVAALEALDLPVNNTTRESLGPILFERLEAMRKRRGQ